jgi:hypothetical protein
LVNDLWETEVKPQLPADLEEQARHHKALQRKRKLNNSYDLLRALLAYALAGLSTRQWGSWAVITGLADISSQGWAKWLSKSGAWLEWLFAELTALDPLTGPLFSQSPKRILLIDATRLGQLGGTGDDWRLHTAYNLMAGRIAQVRLTDRSQGEKLSHFKLQPGDIVVTDRGYGCRRSISIAHQAQAEVVLRIQPDKFPLEDDHGRRVAVWPLLKAGRNKAQVWELQAYCTDQKQTYAVRLIACQLPQEQADLARKRLKDRARKKGKTLSAKQSLLAGWVLLITTLAPPDWSAADLVRLYRARWQIELLFKRIKQMLKMHTINCTRPDRAQATIYALLVAWVLQESQAAQIRHLLEQTRRAAQSSINIWPPLQPLSRWLLHKLCLQTLKHQVLGYWSMARLRACLPRLLRFLTTKHRQRLHQETDVCLWLHRLLNKQSTQLLDLAA